MKTFVSCLIFFLFFKNSNAQILDWAFSIGSPEQDWTYTEDLDIDPWGNTYITGRYDGTMDIDPGPEEYLLESDGYTFFIAKYNPDGELIFGYGLEDVEFFRCIHIDDEGNLYMAGKLGDECCVDFDFGPADSTIGYFPYLNPDYFAVYNSSMALQRVVVFDYDMDLITKASDVHDNIIVTGEIGGHDEVDIDPGPGIYLLMGPTHFLAKYDKNINLKWAKTYSDIASNLEITTDDNANIYIQNIAELYNDTLDCDFGPDASIVIDTDFLAKYDSLGNLLWINKYERFRNNVYDINSAGEIYTTGSLCGDGYPCDIDPGPGEYNVVGDGNLTYYFSKYNNNGHFLWAKLITSDFRIEVLDIELDDSSNMYITGFFGGYADFDPGLGVYSLETLGDIQPFLAKYDSSGNILWATQIYGGGIGLNLTSFNSNEIIWGGAFTDYTFYIGEDSIPLTWIGYEDYFLIKYLQDAPSGLDEIEHDAIRIYPNPASEFIQLNSFTPNSLMQVFDMYGNELIRKQDQDRLDISSLSPGVYILVVSDSLYRLNNLKFIKL